MSATATARTGAGGAAAPPVWFERLLVGAATGVAVAGLVALVLAMVGSLTVAGTVGAVVAAAVAAVGAAVLAVPSTGDADDGPGAGRSGHLAAAAVLVLAVASATWSGWAPSRHVLTDRDPAVYVNAAEWMSRHGTLRVEDPLAAFRGDPRVGSTSPGLYSEGRDLEFQFGHLAPAVLSVVATGLGDAGLYRATGVVLALGLLAVWSVAVRVTGRPWWSLVAPAAVAASMPAVASGRDVFSEPFVLLLVWTAMVLLARCWPRADVAPAALAGVLLGASLAARADTAMALAAPPVLLAGAILLCERPRVAAWWRAAGAFVAGLLLPAAVGLVDLHAFSGGYPDLISDELLRTYAVVGLAVLLPLAATLVRWRRTDPWWPRPLERPVVAGAVGAAVSAALAALWLVRPLVQRARSGGDRWDAIGVLQQREGQAVDLARTYAEHAIGWMAWYLGPATVALAVAGCGAAVALLLRRRAPAALAVLLAVAGAGGAVYLWRPSIYPDQVWAARRFLPLVLPALVVLAVWVVGLVAGLVADVVERRRPLHAAPAVWRRAVLGIGGVLVVVPPALATAPVALQRSQHGVPAVVRQACDLAGDDAAVLVVGPLSEKLLPAALRTWCDVPVGVTNPETLTDAELAGLAGDLAARGRRLVLVTMDEDGFDPYPTAAATARSTASVSEDRMLEHTLSRRPSRYQRAGDRFYQPATVAIRVAPVEPADAP